MKSFLYYLVIGILGIGMIGCGDFLEESSQDEVRPSTVDDLEQLLLGEGYLRTDVLFPYLELLTDNVQNNFSTDESMTTSLQQGSFVFTWSDDMFERLEELNTLGRNTWELLYSKIKGCNVVLDMLSKVTGTEANKLNQKGQALALRAYYYFLLVNTFAEPYNKEGIDQNRALGVPLILSSEVKDEFPARESLAKVYSQIEKDLLEAVDLLDKYGQNNVKYKVTPLFVYNLLSRLYLYKEDWKKAADYASVVIERNPQLLQFLSDFVQFEPFILGGTSITVDKANGGVYNYNSPELIWGYGDTRCDNQFFPAPFLSIDPTPIFSISDKFLASYHENDLRPYLFGKIYGVSVIPMVIKLFLCGEKADPENRSNSFRGMRVAESYLNRAEANIRLFMENGNEELRVSALKDLNYLREHRYKQPYEDVTEVENLLEFCLEERRKELAFEDHRWFDLRRCGMPEIVHELTITQGQPKEYRLEKGSKRYVLPIPRKVLEKNPALIQNP